MQQNGLAVVPAIIPAVELSGLFDPRSEGSLTGEERELLSALLANEDRIDEAMPSTISSDDLWRALELCCKVQSRVRRVQSVLKMLVGRALILIESRPSIYKDRNFVSLDAFLSDSERGLPAITGISRGELYNAKKIAQQFPDLTVSEYAQVGFSKLLDLSKVVNGRDSTAKDWIETAKTSTQAQLREKIYASENGIERDSLEIATLSLVVSLAEKKRIELFLSDPEIQAFCGTPLAGAILCRVVEESEEEWRVQLRAQQEDGR